MVATVRNLTSASATSEYFQEDGGYYLKNDDRALQQAKQAEHRNGSAWYGRGARALGLEPGKHVSAGKFEKLLKGHVIGTDVRLGRLCDGQHEHRPGFDITFSAPKSVSLAALLPTEKHPRGDRGVMRAHDEAVRTTLDWIEDTMLETRGWDPATRRRPRIKSPSMVAATFRHIASRNLDPQLHTHAVIANMTRDAQGRWKSVEPMSLHRNARLIGAYYRNELSRRLIEKGYSILPAMAGRIQSFEIAGYDKELRDAFSTRRSEILEYLEKEDLDYSQASTQIASYATRKRKAEPVRAMLETKWTERVREMGLATVPSVTRSRQPIVLPAVPSALEIVGRAMQHLEERQSVFAECELEALALGHSPGRHSIGEIRDAVEWMVRDGHLVEAQLRRSDRSFVTRRALKAERSVIATMKAGMGAGRPLAREEAVATHLAGAGLTEGQEEAVRTVLLASDRTVGVQGRAGTGKTVMLRQVRELAGDRPVIGLAPSAAVARVLQRESGMLTRTLQWFLARCQGVTENGRAIEDLKERFGGSVLVLDEAAMVSTDQMRSLMRIADELDVARLVLVGDTRQLRAVEAGQPFRLLQRAGMTTVRMDEILRQRDPTLLAAVQAVLAGDPGEAVELLDGSVHEVPYDDLGERAAQTWLALEPEVRERTLLVAPTHELRRQINRTVREALAAEGVLRGKPLRIERLVSLGMTRAEKADARNYREDDTVVFHQDLVNYRLKKDEMLTVTGIEGDRVQLLHPDGGARSIRPRGSIRYRLDVYETRPIEIRAGDRIRWTRNDKARTLINGERAEVTAIAGGRVRFRLEDGRSLSLRVDDPQLRHIDHAWSSTVHGAQGITADGVIAVLDSSHGALTDQSTFYVEISRARDQVVVLTDSLVELVEMLEANTGERATVIDAVDGRIDEWIEPGPEELARLLPEKAPVWTPREELAALEARARREGTVLFHVEGYGALIERVRKLALLPDLPAEVGEVTGGLLAYDLACREQGAVAGEFLGLLDSHAGKRSELEEAAEAEGCTVAGLEDYPDWRDTAGRLLSNGEALIEGLGEHTGDAGRRIPERLEQLTVILALDDAIYRFETLRREVRERAEVAGTRPFYADGHDGLLKQARALVLSADLPAHVRDAVKEVIADAGICAFREEVAALLLERQKLEKRAGDEPPTVLDDYAGWSKRCEEAAGRWRGMRDDPGTWQPHLDRLSDEAKGISSGIGRLEELRGHDRAWARFFAMRGTIVEEARTRSRYPFHLGGWGAFVAEARALAERSGLLEGAERAAERVLEYDRRWRTVESFFERAREHGERWDALQEETERRVRRDPEFSIVDLPEYGPLSEFARGVRETGTAIRDNEESYRHQLDRARDGRKGFASALKRLEGHVSLDRFVAVMDRLAETKRSAQGRSILPFQDDAYNEAIGEAKSLAQESELEDAARRRLQAELDKYACLAEQWLVIEQLLRDMGTLEEQYGELQERAAREEIPRTLLPEWPEWREQNRRFEEDARWTLYDDDLVENWQSYPDILDSIEEGFRRARERIPERDTEQIAEMVATELARLRDPDAEHAFSREWWGGEPLVAGDRLLLRQPPGGPTREAVVLGPGWSGGCASEDVLTLEWVATAPGNATEMPIQRILVSTLADCGVRRADWTDERLRDAELARQQPGPSAAFPLDCKGGVAVGDLLRWTEMVEPQIDISRAGRPAGTGLAQVVHFEGQLVGRTAGKEEKEDSFTVEVLWRSDGASCVPMGMSFGMLTGGGVRRTFQDDEAERAREALKEKRELDERREILRQPGPHEVKKLG